MANKLYRSHTGFKPASAQAAKLQVSKLVATGQADTSVLPVIDLQRAFSQPAVVAANVLNSRTDIVIRVDNAVRAGYLHFLSRDAVSLKKFTKYSVHGSTGRGLIALAAATWSCTPGFECR